MSKDIDQEKDFFSVKKGQLVRVLSIEFDKNGFFIPVKKYAIVMYDYYCNWLSVNSNAFPITVLFKDGKQEKVKPMKIEIITDLSKEKIEDIIFDILLTA